MKNSGLEGDGLPIGNQMATNWQPQRGMQRDPLPGSGKGDIMAKAKKKLKCITFTWEGKRVYCYGKTLAEASAKAEERKKELAEKTWKKSGELTLDEYFENWLDNKRGTVKDITLYQNKTTYKAVSEYAIDESGHKFGSLKLRDIEKQMIVNMQKDLAKKNRSSTVNMRIDLLKALLKTAENDRIIEWNPCKGISPLKRTELTARETIHRALTIDETKAFLEAAKDNWYYNLFVLLLNSGMRMGEAGALRITDIKGDHIEIRRTLSRAESGAVILGEDAKTESGKRNIPLTDALREAIESQKKINSIVRGNGGIVDMGASIFTSFQGMMLTDGNVIKNINSICRKAGIDHFTVHAFRDTFATRAIESGMKPKTLQEILGHSDFTITMSLYAHVMENTKAEEMNLVKITG